MFNKIPTRGAGEKILVDHLDDNVQALQPTHRKAVGLPTKSTKATEACQIAMQQMVIGYNIIDLASCFARPFVSDQKRLSSPTVGTS